MTNPCVSCGACCAFFRVQFTREDRFSTPPEFVESGPHNQCMRGTDKKHRPHCAGLVGRIGKDAKCSIYRFRPTPCRAFTASFIDGKHNRRCDEARKAHGLPPLKSSDWKKTNGV